MGSSSSRSDETRPRPHNFTQVNPRLLNQNTDQPSIPSNASRSSRVPNYVYQVPRDDSLSSGTTVSRSASSSGHTTSAISTRPIGSTTTSSGSTNSVNTGATVPRTASSSGHTTSAISTRPIGSTTTSSGSTNSDNTTATVPRTASSSMSPTASMVSSINSSHNTASSGTFGSTQNESNSNINRRNSESKENLSSGVQSSSDRNRNGYNRRRANGDSQTGSDPHLNRRSESGTRQYFNGNQGRGNMDWNNSEMTGGRRTNSYDSGNRHPRNRNQRPGNMNLNYSDDSGGSRMNNNDSRNRNRRNVNFDNTEVSGDDKTKEVHDAFMKKLVGTFPPNYDKFRGIFCAACNHYELFIGRRPNVKHIDTVKHKSNIGNNPRIKSLSCSTCKVMLHCDLHFLVAHKQSEIHMFISDQRRHVAEPPTVETSKKVERTLMKSDNILNLKKDIKEKFLQRLELSSEINDYSFYCHMCEHWFTSHEDWDAHLKKLHDSSDTKEMNMTFKHCQPCKLMMCGSKLLCQFHADSSEHEKFRTYLNIPSLSESDDDDDDDDDGDTRDDVSTTSSKAAKEQQPQKPTYLVLKNLPPNTTKRDIFKYFKDFGHLENWEMNPIGENTAVVQFRFGSVAENIVHSRFPLQIHGARFDACLQYF